MSAAQTAFLFRSLRLIVGAAQARKWPADANESVHRTHTPTPPASQASSGTRHQVHEYVD